MATQTANGLTIQTPAIADATTYVRTVSKFFLQAHPEFLPCERNMNQVLDYMRENGLVYNAENLEAAYQHVKDDLMPAMNELRLEEKSPAEVKKIYEKYGTPRYEFGKLIGYDLPKEWLDRPRTNGAQTPRNTWESNSSPIPKSVMDEKIASGSKLSKKEFALLTSKQYVAFISANGGEIPSYLK